MAAIQIDQKQALRPIQKLPPRPDRHGKGAPGQWLVQVWLAQVWLGGQSGREGSPQARPLLHSRRGLRARPVHPGHATVPPAAPQRATVRSGRAMHPMPCRGRVSGAAHDRRRSRSGQAAAAPSLALRPARPGGAAAHHPAARVSSASGWCHPAHIRSARSRAAPDIAQQARAFRQVRQGQARVLGPIKPQRRLWRQMQGPRGKSRAGMVWHLHGPEHRFDPDPPRHQTASAHRPAPVHPGQQASAAPPDPPRSRDPLRPEGLPPGNGPAAKIAALGKRPHRGSCQHLPQLFGPATGPRAAQGTSPRAVGPGDKTTHTAAWPRAGSQIGSWQLAPLSDYPASGAGPAAPPAGQGHGPDRPAYHAFRIDQCHSLFIQKGMVQFHIPVDGAVAQCG